MLNAISELNLEVIRKRQHFLYLNSDFNICITTLDEVLIEQEDTQNLLKDLKSKMIERIAALDSTAQDNIKVTFLFDHCILSQNKF